MNSRKKPAWRVLFVITSSDFGGSESSLRELVLHLDRRKFDSVVVSLRPLGRTGAEIAASGVQVLSFNMSERPRLPELFRGALALARWIDRLEIDLVHSFLYRANVLSRIASRLARQRPVMISSHRSLTPLGGRAATLAARWTRSLSWRAVVVSEAVRQQLLRTERLDPERVVVIENGVDTRRFTAADGSEVRLHLGVGPGTLLVGTVARLSPEKGLADLLEGLARVKAQGMEMPLLVVGDGPERQRLEQMAKDLALDGCVRFLGARGDLPALYAALDIFVLPSREEGSPNSVLEAMAAGKAIVASCVGGVPEVIDHETTGLLVPPASPDALAAALARLANDSGLRSRIGLAARRVAAERFDITQMAEKHERLYHDLLAEDRQTR